MTHVTHTVLGIIGLNAVFTGMAKEKPDIILITADDMGMTAGCYGDSLSITPNLDRLAAEGVLFTDAYVTHASCSPSRSSILTGLFPHQNGHVGLSGSKPANGEPYRVAAGTPTLTQLLKNGGYYTGILGKLHVSPGDMFPFDSYPWRETLLKPELTRDVRKVATCTGDFIKQAGNKPFFLYVNYFDPHFSGNRSDLDNMNQAEGLPEKPYTAQDVKPFSFLGEAAYMEDVAAYYNAVNRLDAGLGLLFDELKKAGRYDNTLIIFISDNGADFTRAKTTCYEAGVRVPFIVKWPGVSTAGLKSGDFISAVDIMPTVLDAAGVRCPQTAGVSLRPVLQKKTPADWRTGIFTEYTSHANAHFFPRRTMRIGDMKVIQNLDAGRANPVPRLGVRMNQVTDPVIRTALETASNPPEWELYDLGKDPDEFKNLAGNSEYHTALKKLQDELLIVRKKMSDPLLNPAELKRQREAHGVK